jgi:hypothetical protein
MWTRFAQTGRRVAVLGPTSPARDRSGAAMKRAAPGPCPHLQVGGAIRAPKDVQVMRMTRLARRTSPRRSAGYVGVQQLVSVAFCLPRQLEAARQYISGSDTSGAESSTQLRPGRECYRSNHWSTRWQQVRVSRRRLARRRVSVALVQVDAGRLNPASHVNDGFTPVRRRLEPVVNRCDCRSTLGNRLRLRVLTHAKSFQRTFRSTSSATTMRADASPVSDALHQGFNGTCDTVLTQKTVPCAVTSTHAEGVVHAYLLAAIDFFCVCPRGARQYTSGAIS